MRRKPYTPRDLYTSDESNNSWYIRHHTYWGRGKGDRGTEGQGRTKWLHRKKFQIALTRISAAYTASITASPPTVTLHSTGPFACNDLPSATCNIAVLFWNAMRTAFVIPASVSKLIIVAPASVSNRNWAFVSFKFPNTNALERIV